MVPQKASCQLGWKGSACVSCQQLPDSKHRERVVSREREKIHLIDISRAIRRRRPQRRIHDVRQFMLRGLLILERGVPAHRHDRDELVHHAPKPRIDGTIPPLLGRQSVPGAPHVPDHEAARGRDRLERVDDGGMVAGHVHAADGPAARQGRVAGDLGLEERVVEVVEGGEGLDGRRGVGDAERREVVEEGLDEGLEFGRRLGDAHEGVHVQVLAGRAELVVDVEPRVNPRGAVAVEGGDGLPEEGCVGGVRRVDVEGEPGARVVLEGLVGRFDNDGERGRAAAAESPEEVGVGFGVGGFERPVGGDDLEFEGRVGEEAVEVG